MMVMMTTTTMTTMTMTTTRTATTTAMTMMMKMSMITNQMATRQCARWSWAEDAEDSEAGTIFDDDDDNDEMAAQIEGRLFHRI
nr:hypothetical protein BaRGS_011496 [Batillaria attramentaria]